MASGKQYKRFAGHSVNNAGYHNENWDRFFDGNSLYDVGFDSLADAIAYIGTSTKTLYITTKHRIARKTTIPSNISVVRLEGGGFTSSNASTLTINGPFSSPDSQAFFGDLVVVFGEGSEDRPSPKLWGTTGLGVADDIIPLQKCADCCAASATSDNIMTFYLPPGLYLTSDTLLFDSVLVDIDMQGVIKANDFVGPAIKLYAGQDVRFNSRNYRFKATRATLNWTNGAGQLYDDGTWTINSIGVQLYNLNRCNIRFESVKQFDVGIDWVCETSCTFNEIKDSEDCRNNQIAHRITTPGGAGVGFWNDNLLISGNYRIDNNVALDNKSRYTFVFDDVQDVDNNIFLKPACELSADFNDLSNEEALVIFASGEFFANRFIAVRGENAAGMGRLEIGTQGGVKEPAYNTFIAGGGMQPSMATLTDNTRNKVNYLQQYRSAGEVASPFNTTMIDASDLYYRAVTVVENASLGTNNAGVDGFFVCNVSTTPTWPAGGNHFTNLTDVKADSSTRSIRLATTRGVGITFDKILGTEEFLVQAQAPAGELLRVGIRPYASDGSLITSTVQANSVVGVPSELISYNTSLMAWAHGTDKESPNVRFKLANANIVAIDIIVFGGSGNGSVMGFRVLSTILSGSGQRPRVRHTGLHRMGNIIDDGTNVYFGTVAAPKAKIALGDGDITAGDGTAETNITQDGVSGSVSSYNFQVGGGNRILIRRTNEAESGTAEGSNFEIEFRDNTTTVIDKPVRIVRKAGGALTLTRPFGYRTGASVGGTNTQATSKSTGVTLNRVCGQITTANDALAAGAVVSFTLTNSFIEAADILMLQNQAGGTLGAYHLEARCAAGSATITIRNLTAGSLSEAIVIGFALIKGATT